MDRFIFNENTRVIGVGTGAIIVTNDPSATLDDPYSNGALVETSRDYVSPEISIGVLITNDVWQPVNYNYNQYMLVKKNNR